MRIIQFITRMDVLGGAQMHVFELSKELASNGHQVTVLGLGTGELTEELEQAGIEYKQLENVVVPIRPIRDFFAFFEVRKIIKEINPDMIALHSSKAGILGRLVGRSLNIPTIFTAHGWSFAGAVTPRKRSFFTKVERFAGKLTSGVITVSEFDYKQALLEKVIPPEKMQVIHNGIPDYAPQKETLWPSMSSVVRLMMVARFAEPKDHMLLLKALNNVRVENWHLTLVGDGPLLQRVKDYVAAEQLDEKVEFTGACRNVAGRFAETDIFVLVSKSEGLPISVIEAMRAGVAVIASDVGGVSELIEHKESGLLVDKGDQTGWTKTLTDVIENSAYRYRLGKAARKKFTAQFRFAEMYRRTESYYTEIMGNENRRQLI